MNTYRVRSGDRETSVRALNHKVVAFIAVNKELRDLDGFIVVLKKNDCIDMEVTFSSAKILDDMQLEPFSIEEQN